MIGSRAPIAVKPGIIGSSMSKWGKKLGRVLTGEMTAQPEHLPYVKTRACGLHSATYLRIENTTVFCTFSRLSNGPVQLLLHDALGPMCTEERGPRACRRPRH